MDKPLKIAVIGLGYVGLSVAVALAKYHTVTGFDNATARVDELRSGLDRTNEISRNELNASKITLVSDVEEIRGFDVYIVAVPTPVDERSDPDLTAITSASTLVGVQR